MGGGGAVLISRGCLFNILSLKGGANLKQGAYLKLGTNRAFTVYRVT